MRTLAHRGFTIIEMIMVVVLLGIVSVAIVNMITRVNEGSTENSEMLVGAQLMQECGEWILTNHRREDNFFTLTLATSANCYALTTHGGFNAPQVNVTAAYVGVASDPTGCPNGATCKVATISVTKGADTLTPVNLLVVRWNPL